MSERTLSDLLVHTGNPLLQIGWVLLIVIIVKTLTTGFTLMTGGSAGLLVPAMILGGSMGACMFYLLSGLTWVADANAQIFIIAGITSSLVAVGVCRIISRNMRMYAKQRAS